MTNEKQTIVHYNKGLSGNLQCGSLGRIDYYPKRTGDMQKVTCRQCRELEREVKPYASMRAAIHAIHERDERIAELEKARDGWIESAQKYRAKARESAKECDRLRNLCSVHDEANAHQNEWIALLQEENEKMRALLPELDFGAYDYESECIDVEWERTNDRDYETKGTQFHRTLKQQPEPDYLSGDERCNSAKSSLPEPQNTLPAPKMKPPKKPVQIEAMTSERIQEIQEVCTAYPNSQTVKRALLQVWNECGIHYNGQIAELGKLTKKLKLLHGDSVARAAISASTAINEMQANATLKAEKITTSLMLQNANATIEHKDKSLLSLHAENEKLKALLPDLDFKKYEYKLTDIDKLARTDSVRLYRILRSEVERLQGGE